MVATVFYPKQGQIKENFSYIVFAKAELNLFK